MTARLLAATAACALAVAVGACGGDSSDNNAPAASGQQAKGKPPPNPNDKRGVAYQCITQKEGLAARFTGQQSIQVGGNGGPRVEFFVSQGEAEGQQFQGKAQSAEQIGAALLFINDGTEDQLTKLEKCLDEQ